MFLTKRSRRGWRCLLPLPPLPAWNVGVRSRAEQPSCDCEARGQEVGPGWHLEQPQSSGCLFPERSGKQGLGTGAEFLLPHSEAILTEGTQGLCLLSSACPPSASSEPGISSSALSLGFPAPSAHPPSSGSALCWLSGPTPWRTRMHVQHAGPQRAALAG